MANSDASGSEKREGGEPSEPKKIRRTLTDMINSMKLTAEEVNYRLENFDQKDVVDKYQKYLKCTKCDTEFKDKINEGQEVGSHPLLGVLMCDSCRDYYGDGNFSLDSEGEDKYCRWCGEGGTIFSCSKCICAFCDVCIKKHFGEEEVKTVENDDDWTCFVCNSKPLWNLRSICSLALQASQTKKEQLGKITVKIRKTKKYKKGSEKENDKSCTSDSSYSVVNEREGSKKRRNITRLKNNWNKELSSSSEEDAGNFSRSKKRAKIKKKSSEKESDTGSSTDKNFIDPTFENKKTLFLNKLKSVLKFTESIVSAGLSLTKKRLKQLEEKDSFKNLEDLQTVHNDIKFFTASLANSAKTASNSIDSIRGDLSFDSATDETEIFRAQEKELKRLQKKFERKSYSKNSAASDSEDSSGSESKEETEISKRRSKPKKKEEEKGEVKENGIDGKSSEELENSKPLFSESKCEENNTEQCENNENSTEKETIKREKSEPRQPLLRVKAFARMLDENVLSKKVEVFDITSDNECENKEDNKQCENTVDDKSDNKVNDKNVSGAKVEHENAEKKKSLNNSKSKNKKQTSDEDSSDESIVGKRRKKKATSDHSSSSEEEVTLRKTRSQKRKQQQQQPNQIAPKSIFEKFKKKRENFIKTRKQNAENDESKKGNQENSKPGTDSDEEKDEKLAKQKKKRIIDSSDEGQENKPEQEESKSEQEEKKSGKEDNGSDGKILTSSDESEIQPKKRKKKRKDSSNGTDDEKNKKKGRRNIKKILKKDSLQLETKEALKNEEARRKRVKEKQKLLEKLFPDDGRIILDFDPEKKEPLVTVHKRLAKKLKPHQVKGVKFMWDNCFESVQRLEEDSGSGCILAHCMGLGKTLQVITLVHTVMNHDLGVNTVLIVCPLSTVSNWIREFESWLADVNTEPIMLFDLVKYKKKQERAFHFKDWLENGGVLVISYDLFRNLIPSKKKERKTIYARTIETALLDPGPDLVVCDEGHLLKNEDSALSKCMSRIKTSRRIVLTGTPLQNNLAEYHCMVQFVKPNILGNKKEFSNRFVNPINNGQFEDSTEFDVKIMKRRSHVLHSILEGCIQRYDYSVLTPYLPEKQEYVLSVSVTEKQAKAYQHFVSALSAKSQGGLKGRALFHDYHSLQRIWTHPRTLLMQSERETEREFLKDEEESLKDFIVSSDEESETPGSESSGSEVEVQPKKRILRSNANDPEVLKAMEQEEKPQNKRWWNEFYDEDTFDDLRESNKLILLFSLLKHCKEVGDKLLVFSQSLYSLDLIEYFLREINDSGRKNNKRLGGYTGTWHLNTDYFRLDGSSTSDQRAAWCKYFNKGSNTRARLFLISTRAGGLGINLYGANRVVIFDASWNPSHDVQSIFRVYRFGQKKPCFIYRFLAEGTMEEKIYQRQVTKLSLAHRVLDEHQIERHYKMGNLMELYEFKQTTERSVPKVPKDSVLADLLHEHKDIIVGYHEHDSLLENKEEEELTEEERKAAWKEYEDEKERKMTATINSNMMLQQQQHQMLWVPQPNANPSFRVLNPAYVTMNQPFGAPNQTFVNPMAGVPLDILERGIRVGVTPLPNESADSYVSRVVTREAWMQMKLSGN